MGILESILYKSKEKVGIFEFEIISNGTREWYFVRGWVIVIYYLLE